MPRLTRLRYVDCWPSVFPSRYVAGGAPARIRKQSTAVTELYSRHLSAGEALADTWWIRLGDPLENLPDGFPCQPKDGAPGGFGLAWAILDLPEPRRRLALLDVVHLQLMVMAVRAGWPTTPLQMAYDACVADNLELHLTSTPKASPDRRLRAHLTFTIDGNGDGRTALHVHNRHGESVYSGEAWDSPSDVSGWNVIRRSLRWVGPRSVYAFTWPVTPPRIKRFPVEHTVDLAGIS